jgi:glycolate oxidase
MAKAASKHDQREQPAEKNNVQREIEQKSSVYKKLSGIVGENNINDDQFQRILYSHDVAPLPKVMSVMFKNVPDLVLKPRNAREVSRIIKVAAKNDIPVIPRGGGTWGLGGAVPTNGGILLDLGSMNNVLDIDRDNLTITVEPGISWKEVDDIVSSKGMFLGAYPSSAPGASVGGWVNTGGIGIGSYKYGGVEQQIRNLEVVLPDGKIINTGFEKVMANSSGYNLNGLFTGSEGTLGVITKVTIKLYPKPEVIKPLSFTFNRISDLPDALLALSKSRVNPWHVTILDGKHLDFLKQSGFSVPDVDGILNITLEGPKPVVEFEEKELTALMRKSKAKKADSKFAEHEWAERYYELRAKPLGPTALVGEAFVPVTSLKPMIADTRKVINKMKIRAAIAGMVADRNTVVLMPYVLTDERKLVKSLATMAFIKKLGDLAFKHGGRPAGLGTFFSVNLKKMRRDSIDTICDIKASLDPYDIMNPGKLTEGVTRFGVPIPAVGFNMGMSVMGVMKGILPKDK